MSRPQPVEDSRADLPRSPDQVSREAAMQEVSDVLLNLEHTIARAKRAFKAVGKLSDEGNAALALTNALDQLQVARKRLMQDAYFGGDQQRLV